MTIKKFILKLIPNYIKRIRRKILATNYCIIKKPETVLEIAFKIKDETWEDSYYPECYGHCKEQHLSVYNSAQYIYTANNAVIVSDSDVVITDLGVYWDKYNEEEFITWATPCDRNVMWFNRDNIGIRRYKRKETIEGRTLSLIGVWSIHWGHCMYQFLPKLFIAGEAGLFAKDMTILIDEKEDATILELVKRYLKDYPKAKIKYAKSNTEYCCKQLYFMPSLGSNFNDQKFRLDYPYFISSIVLKSIKKYVIDPTIDKVKNRVPKYDKIFLPRGQVRTLVNYNEVHDYFLSLGYIDIEGANLTLEEKADIFYHAKEIVGLYGSALLNLMFCNQAKCMVLINYKMSTDTSLYIQIRDYVSTLVNVTGQDETDNYHSNFYIPLAKIKEAYNKYIQS